MIACNINKTNQTNCKKKISKDNDDNKCKKCEYLFCKNHFHRHKCQPQKEEPQQTPQKLEEQKKQQEPEKESEKIPQQDKQQQKQQQVKNKKQQHSNNQKQQQEEFPTLESKKQETYPKQVPDQNQNQQQKKVYELNNQQELIKEVYQPEEEQVISNEVIYGKKFKMDKETMQNENQHKYKHSYMRQLKHKYVLGEYTREPETYDKYKKQQKQQNQKKQNNQDKNVGDAFVQDQLLGEEQKQEEQWPVQSVDEWSKEQPKQNQNKNQQQKQVEQQVEQQQQQKQEEQVEQKQQILKQKYEPKSQKEVISNIQNVLRQLGSNYQEFKQKKNTQQEQEQQQIVEEEQKQEEQEEEVEQSPFQDELQQEQEEYKKQQQNNLDHYGQSDGNLFEAYQQKNEENNQALKEYEDMIRQEIEEQDIEPLQQIKKQIFDKIDKKIEFSKEKMRSSKIFELSIPSKTKDQYNFRSVNQENKYKKILPMDVYFPGEPYKQQQDFMYKILNALDSPQEENILIESPSGTGKTLSLLSSCLAFLKKHREVNKVGYRYQIVYASRTYQQLQQVANEIKNTGYNLRTTILGSQQEMCVNQEVLRQFFNGANRKFQKSQNFSLLCQTACRSQKCKAQHNSNQQMEEIANQRKIVDIEEIDRLTQNFSNKSTSCPYFNTVNNVDSQDVLLVPYEVILDERGIKRLGKIPKRLLIILDEAHNVLEEACTGSSYRLDILTLEKVLEYVENIKIEVNQSITYLNQNKFYFQQDFYKQQKQFQIQTLRYQLDNAQFMGFSERQIEQIRVQISDLQHNSIEKFQEQQLQQMQNTIKSVQILQTHLQQVYDSFKSELHKNHRKKIDKYKLAETYPRIIAKLFQREEDEIKLINMLKSLKQVRDYSYQTRAGNNKNQSLAQMAPFEEVIFFFHSLLLSVKQNPQYYKLLAEFQDIGYLNQSQKNMHFILQCFEPELALTRLLAFPQSHFILTSSTMTPFESFLKEFSKLKKLKKMPFQTHLFRDHVIRQENFMGRILNIQPQMENNKKRKPWNCGYCKTQNDAESIVCKLESCKRGKPSFLRINSKNTDTNEPGKFLSKQGQKIFEEIGYYFEQLVPHIPGGILVVFPSLNLMEKCRIAWFQGSQYGSIIEKHTKIFFQPRKKFEYRDVVAQYKEHIQKHKKGMLFSIIQTDFLDSFDCKDNLSRTVFIVGKPGMDSNDGYVQEKMEYFDQQKQSGKIAVDKWHWFNDYSIRLINKAIGKVIRHKDDYGAVYMIDDVYNTSKWIADRISVWARDRVKTESDIKKLVEDTQQFYAQEFQQIEQKQQGFQPYIQPEDFKNNNSSNNLNVNKEQVQLERDIGFLAEQTSTFNQAQSSEYDALFQAPKSNQNDFEDDNFEEDDFM